MFARHIALPFDPSRPIVSLTKPSDYLNYLARHRQIALQAARANVLRHQRVGSLVSAVDPLPRTISTGNI